jgi:hypothetical protein
MFIHGTLLYLSLDGVIPEALFMCIFHIILAACLQLIALAINYTGSNMRCKGESKSIRCDVARSKSGLVYASPGTLSL